MKKTWLSAYIFYHGSHEQLLREWIAPFLQQSSSLLDTISPYFFIRYGEGGPHIRLRMLADVEQHREIHARLESAGSDFFIQHPAGNAQEPIRYIPYVPETERYGNQQTIMLAEEQFFLSSQCVLQQLCEQTEWGYTRAFMQAVYMHVCLFHALQEDRATVEHICEQFIRRWLPRMQSGNDINTMFKHMENMYRQYALILEPGIAALWEALTSGMAERQLQLFATGQQRVFQKYRLAALTSDEMQGVIGSMLHMTHNRLGIPNPEESYLVYFTLKCMQHIYEHRQRTH